MELSLDSKNTIVRFLLEKLNPELIYLYGSFARGEGRTESDIDLAVYGIDESGPYTLFLLANELAQSLKRDVDLVDLKAASTVFRAQVITRGELLYCRDKTFRGYYEMRVLKDYAKLNEERKVILDVIREEGSVYNG
ncbi:MAG: nucleotidyltransferase domain-containing protein [Limnochordia bacterium]|jgi:predicted nucleotidyltransferase|nr:nucleotidyltransferase domain-containing protein [Limnochordia bacterium]